MTSAQPPMDLILSRLNAVTKSGRGYRAECPACGGRSKKLAIAEASNGSVLMHCFGCGSVADVLAALGLEMTDLYPPRVTEDSREQRLANRRALREAGWDAAIRVVAHEAYVVAMAGFAAAEGKPLPQEDLARLLEALHRVEDAKMVLCER